MWWIKKQAVTDPLFTTTTDNPPDFFDYAKLQQESTILLFGQENIDYKMFSGGRFSLGLLLNDTCEIELRGFFLGQKTFQWLLVGDSFGNPPIFEPQINMEPLFLVPVFDNNGNFLRLDPSFGSTRAGFPTSFNGTVEDVVGNTFYNGPVFVDGVARVTSSSEFWGAESNAVFHLNREGKWKVDVVAGFRLLGLDEGLDIFEATSNFATNPNFGFSYLGGFFIAQGSRHEELDSFKTHNRFYGGQIGARVERQWGRLSLGSGVKLALGGTQQELKISGSTFVIPQGVDIGTPVGSPTGTGSTIIPFVPVSDFGGVYTNPANIGKHKRGQFSTVSEVNAEVGFDVCSYLRLTVGYTLMYWSNVVRPGEQTDLLVNQAWIPSGQGFDNQFSGNPFPRVPFTRSDFWAQGISFGIDFRY
jgi:hypothetical protein